MSDTPSKSLDLVVQEFNLGTLTTNALVILETVKTKLEGYKAENYSEENIQKAKQDKAELNTAASQLNAHRLDLEKKWMKPFEEGFKDIIAEAVTLIGTASKQIDVVVKEVEEREKAEKKAKIEAFFLAQGCELFTLDRIFSPTWLNKTTKLKDVQAEITTRIIKTNEDLAVLDKIGEPEAKAHYLVTLDLTKAIAKADEIKKNRERLAAIEKAKAEEESRKKAEAEERARIEAERKARPPATPPLAQVPIAEPVIESVPNHTPKPVSVEPEPILEFTLRFSGTKEQLQALKTYMKDHGIEYEKIA